jgi:hypothetical protein
VLEFIKTYSIAVVGSLKTGTAELARVLAVLAVITTVISTSGCSDPYDQCMKEEKRKNAYLGEEEYLKQSAASCARKVRLLES